MARGDPVAVTAAKVGSYFVGRYYPVLQQRPDLAHQFYTDGSTMIRVDGDLSGLALATSQIHMLIMSLNFTGIDIETINSLESWSGGVLVVVSGSVQEKDYIGRRKFVQTFLLAPQEKGYFILNDIFHFINEDVVHQHTVPMLSENKIDTQLLPSTPLPDPPDSNYGLEAEAGKYVNLVHIDGYDPVDSLQEYLQQQQQGPEADTLLDGTPAEEPSTWLESVVEAVPDHPHAVEEPVRDPQKFTYASILQAPKGQSVPSIASRPSFTKIMPPASQWHHAQPAAQLLKVPESSLEAAEENPSVEEGELESVYLRNFPPIVSAADIEQECKTRIAPDREFIRKREFEDLHAVRNAIKASPVQLAGRQVHVEEGKANSSSISRGDSEVKSVYLKNLSPFVSPADIEQKFMTFGRIAPDGIVIIRNREYIRLCNAFVNYEDPQAVRNAIKASPIQLAGRQVYVEESRANGGSTSQGGRRGRGRGHFGARSFGRG